jgi:membrane protein YqaA with SNARE-associated domain
MNLILYGQFQLFSIKIAAIHVAISAILGALGGTVVGWWLGRGTSAAA